MHLFLLWRFCTILFQINFSCHRICCNLWWHHTFLIFLSNDGWTVLINIHLTFEFLDATRDLYLLVRSLISCLWSNSCRIFIKIGLIDWLSCLVCFLELILAITLQILLCLYCGAIIHVIVVMDTRWLRELGLLGCLARFTGTVRCCLAYHCEQKLFVDAKSRCPCFFLLHLSSDTSCWLSLRLHRIEGRQDSL